MFHRRTLRQVGLVSNTVSIWISLITVYFETFFDLHSRLYFLLLASSQMFYAYKIQKTSCDRGQIMAYLTDAIRNDHRPWLHIDRHRTFYQRNLLVSAHRRDWRNSLGYLGGQLWWQNLGGGGWGSLESGRKYFYVWVTQK